MRYLFGLQYLRAVAALGVVGFHASESSHLNFDLGQAGVDLFFVLSGFLMWSITETPITPMAFLVGRVRRIVPVYWIATSVVLVGALLSLFPAITLNTPHVLSSFFFIPARSPSNGHIWPLLVPGWTLNYEMFFYLVFSLVLFLPRRIQLLVMLTIFGGLVASRGLAQLPAAELSFYSDPIILEFIAGMIIAFFLPALQSAKLGVALLSMALFCLFVAGIWSEAPRAVAWGIPASLLIMGTISIERSNSLPNLAILGVLGDASYSIYLWHTLAISLSRKMVVPLNLPVAIYFLVLSISGVLVGLALYYAIERPLFRYLSASVRSTPKPVADGVSLSNNV